MERPGTTLTLSLVDVSLLARVQRPVVSMWRTRSRNTATPFPDPVKTSNVQELFDADEVVSWLRQTGRGNNPDAAEDAAAFVSNARENIEVLSALLVLRALTGLDLGGMDPEDVLDRAEEIDPDDDCFFREIEANPASLVPLLRLADRLSEASYTPLAAFEKLMDDRSRTERAETVFAPEAIDLLASAAVALGRETRTFADATPDDGEVLLAIADMFDESENVDLGLSPIFQASSRMALRRLRINVFSRENLRLEGFAACIPGLVTVAHFPFRDQPDLTDQQILAAIDDISLEMDSSQAAVILAPARLLTDALPSGSTARIRDSLLRSGKIRAAVRLPAGLLASRPRQPMALWVIGKERIEVPIAERWMMVADLSTTGLDETGHHDLVADLQASMHSREAIRARAFRYGRLVQTRLLLAGDGILCKAPQTTRSSTATGSDAVALLVVAENEIKALNADAGPSRLNIAVEPGDALAKPAATLGDLLHRKYLVLIPGVRLDAADSRAGEGFTVLGLPELRGSNTPRYVDRLVLAADYPRAQLTEPGDVIFSDVGGTTALVDPQGASVVEYPARILRISRANPSGLIASVLAADIHGRQRGPWRRWRVKRFPEEQVENTKAALDAIAGERQSALARVARLDRLAVLLTEGSAVAALRIETSPTMEGSN
ncbi:hypothetical protein BLJ79_18035 [Arthrobacter sp. UCD-GKA]|uniref:hypothetical protein n=1 Tax=Arthrobacter sp. UCD-GKA TaxID=1913576 RepID=UPI0008DD9E57|nr:hypothetical protein [Arthrobacter sp. UCD-GKA]OIH82846.1 hypothetical protein BLJ79_18035 [Arthrobacter sp. UCD-GKA]